MCTTHLSPILPKISSISSIQKLFSLVVRGESLVELLNASSALGHSTKLPRDDPHQGKRLGLWKAQLAPIAFVQALRRREIYLLSSQCLSTLRT